MTDVISVPMLVALGALLLAIVALTLQYRSRRTAQLARARFLGIIEATGFGVLMVDTAGRIVYANQAAADIVGYPVPSMVGQDKHDLLHHGLMDDPSECPLQQALREHRPFFGQEHFVDIRGNLVPVAVSMAPLGEGAPGMALVFRDRSTEVAEERQRHDAISLISHELRSPLTSVVGFSNRLEAAVRTGVLPVDEARAEEVSLLAQEARRMRDIVNVVLDVANLERQTEVEAEPVLLREVVDEEAERLARETPGARIERDGLADAVVESDERYVRRVVQNLLSNAIKYAGTAEPIEVTIEEEHDGYAVRVRDHGPGISPEDQEHIFDRFYRGSDGAKSQRGLGLGLFLSRRLVGRLGGRLTVDSTPGEGATFTMWLPRELPVLPREPASPADRLIW